MLLNNGIPFWYIFKKVRLEFLIVVLFSGFVFYYTNYHRGDMPKVPTSIPSFLGTAISVLLSFKLAQSYGRWWEARTVWGMIVNDSRTLVMQLLAFSKKDYFEEVKQIGMRQIAWCYGLSNSLRKLDPLAAMKPYLNSTDLQAVEKHMNMPLGLLQLNNLQIADLYRKDAFSVYHHKQLDGTITRLCVSMGAAERIKGTVFPSTYSIFVKFSIFVFIFTFVVSLEGLHFITKVPLAVIISTIFLLLDKTAEHMQDPFENRPTDTAMSTISRNIEINIKQLLDEPNVPKPLDPEKFFTM
ncbi:MAG: hypothetical protein KF687_09000 [Cyclobacteriaceae bacterium]|nr:hypothetical protein [Cyclobacteriaceae bacterium]